MRDGCFPTVLDWEVKMDGQGRTLWEGLGEVRKQPTLLLPLGVRPLLGEALRPQITLLRSEGRMCTAVCWRPEGPGKAGGRLPGN